MRNQVGGWKIKGREGGALNKGSGRALNKGRGSMELIIGGRGKGVCNGSGGE